jgi:Xaa-Pro aminopeptidase
MADLHHRRLSSLRAILRQARAAVFVVSHRPNLFYLTGFTGDAGMLVVEPARATLFTDGRFTTQARKEAHGVRLAITRKALAAEIGAYLRVRVPGRTIAFEEDRLSVAQFHELRRAGGRRLHYLGLRGQVEGMREVKSAAEIARMRAAAALGSRIMRQAISLVRPGISERELAAEIEYRMKQAGAEGPSFETIVASGPRSALPHGRPTSKRLKKKELVVIDLGVILRGYCSDLTRTVHIGRASPEVRRWYAAVLAAQQAARAAVRAGVAAGEVDEAARGILRRERLDRFFIHSTGHGLGLEVHERPSLGASQAARLRAGSVVTIEPGIYIPGRGGIRIEDDVLVLPGGPETLTSAPRDLMEI